MDEDTNELLTEKNNKQRLLQSIANFMHLISDLKGFRGCSNVEFVISRVKKAIANEEELRMNQERDNPDLLRIRDEEEIRRQKELGKLTGTLTRNRQ